MLNQSGRNLLSRAKELSLAHESGTISMSDAMVQAVKLANEVPSPQNPRLELYQKPDPAPFLEATKTGTRSIILEPSNGCENQCHFCYARTSAHMVFMPYPMFLLVAETVRNVSSNISLNVMRTDPLLYRDVLFGANFADLFLSIQDIYANSCSIGGIYTNGWPRGHRFALAAAKKLNENGVRIDYLSVHLCHKEFWERYMTRWDHSWDQTAPSPQSLDEYANRYAEAISLLRPREIALRGVEYPDFPDNNPLSLKYLRSFFREMILPRLSPDLRNHYGGFINSYPYSLHKDGNVSQIAVFGGSGLRRDRKTLPRCADCKEMPNAVLIIYPDGSWSLEKKGILPREKGNLFERDSA